jgi:1-deoxy-D-xylulose-5-phosphate reductoisomerase
MSSIVGSAGLAPTLAAARTGAIVALANKESLVCAGPALLETARAAGGVVMPVDSEHSAIFQVLQEHWSDRGRAAHPDRLGRPVPHWTRQAMAGPPPNRPWPIPTGAWAPRFRSIPPP